MTKAKAMLLAAGLVASLVGGAVAMALGLSGAGSAVADTPKRLDPIVKVRERTVKVEKQAKGSDRPVQVVNLGTGTTDLQSGDDSPESESESHETEDHDSESEDHSTEESHEDESGDD